MHLLAKRAQGVAFITYRVFLTDGRQHIGKRRIVFDMLLKARQHRDQMRHFLRALGGRQQKQDRVEIRLFRHDAVFTQVMREDRRRHAEIAVLAGFCVNAGRGEQQLARVDEILLARVTGKAVPRRARLKAEKAPLAGDGVGRVILPGPPCYRIRNKRFDHPAVGDDRFARLDAKLHTVGPQPLAALAFVDFRVDVQRREQRIKGAGGGVQHEGVIEPLVRAKARLTTNMVIFFVDLRGLREPGLLLVHRLGDENPRIVFVKLQQQRRAVGHHRDKLLIADPRGVKQDVVAQVADFIHHLTGVINGAVVGAKLNDRQPERTRLLRARRGHFGNQRAQIIFLKTALVDPADKPERVARRFEIDRRRARLNKRAVVVGFMVIAIEQHQIALRQQRVGHHFIGRRGAVKHEIGFIGVKYLRGELLRVLGGAFVDQQIAKFHIRVAHVGAKHVFAKEIVKLPARRMLSEELTVLVAGACKGAVLHLHILCECVEKRR